MKEINSMELSYFAGVMDGDGSFSLCKKIDKKGKSPIFYPLIQLSTTNYSLIQMLKDLFSGCITTRKSYSGKDGSVRKESKRWCLDKRNKCFPFLKEINTFLVIKQERAQFLLDYIVNNPFKRGSVALNVDVVKARDVAYFKMRSFNRSVSKMFFKFPVRRKTSGNELFWNYFAGLMDTDGSFSLKRERRVSGCRYSPVISLTMVDHRALYKVIKNCIWGKVYHVKAGTARSGYAYRYGIFSLADTINFLKKLIPYLRLKKKQAEILYEYCLEKKSGLKLSQCLSEDYYKRIVEFNNGVYKPSLIDLEAVAGKADGDRAEGVSHRERLSEKARAE